MMMMITMASSTQLISVRLVKRLVVKSLNDYDGDGCRDETEDLDDDNDGFDAGNEDATCTISSMSTDLCPLSSLEFDSNPMTDNDADGCEDTKKIG